MPNTAEFAQNSGEINLLQEAPRAVWLSGSGRLLFGGNRNDPRGFAIYVKNFYLEDDSVEEIVLETHPRWVDNGWIRGEFYIPHIESGQHFLAKLGFIKPSGEPRTNGVIVKVIFNGINIYEDIKLYTRQLKDIDIDMSRFDKQLGTLLLEVGTNGDSTQDWLVWINPRIGSP